MNDARMPRRDVPGADAPGEREPRVDRRARRGRRSLGWLGGIALIVGVPTAALATYGYVDENGAYQIVDRLGQVPEEYRDKAIKMKSASPDRAPERSAPAQPPAASAPRQGGGSAGDAPIFRMGEGFVEPKAEPVAPPAPTQPEVEVDEDGHDKVWWQNQVVEWANRRAEAQRQLEHLESQKRILTYGRGSEKTAYRRQLKEARAAIEEAEGMLEEELPRRARKAGAKPSWLELPGLEKESRDRR